MVVLGPGVWGNTGVVLGPGVWGNSGVVLGPGVCGNIGVVLGLGVHGNVGVETSWVWCCGSIMIPKRGGPQTAVRLH